MKPILFNIEMVRAILAGNKTVTRRAMKPQPVTDANGNPTFCYKGRSKDFVRVPVFGFDGALVCIPPYCPGDILYVRETWCDVWNENGTWINYGYAADGEPDTDYWGVFRNGVPIKSFKWRTSIHMPREAARIFLRVTDVRVERLQDIAEKQTRAEGAKAYMMTTDVDKPDSEKRWVEIFPALSMFPEIWNSTIKPADRAIYGWEANPWVWVIEFERISKEDAIKRGDK